MGEDLDKLVEVSDLGCSLDLGKVLPVLLQLLHLVGVTLITHLF